MESIEAQFEEILVTEAEGAGEQAANFSIDAFHPSAGEPGFVVAQDSLGMAKEGLGHRMELSDAAGFCLGAPFAQESPGLASVFLLPQLSELFLEQVGTLQGFVQSEVAFQAPGSVFLQVVKPV